MLYALSLQAVRANSIASRVEHSAWAVWASSTEEAEAKGFERSLKLWPKKNGWSQHDASPIEVHLELVEKPSGMENIMPERIM